MTISPPRRSLSRRASRPGAPINITTDSQNLGDIPSPGLTTASYTAKITSDATLGEYTLPLTVHTKYLSNSLANQPTSETIQDQYTPVTVTIPLTIKIKPVVQIDVLNADAPDLVVGMEGYVNLTIRNIGYEDGKQATVTIKRHGDSAVIPTDDNVYIGDFPRDGIVTCLYKVAVSSDAQQQSYPIDVDVTYTNAEGDTVISAIDTVGVPWRTNSVCCCFTPGGRHAGIDQRDHRGLPEYGVGHGKPGAGPALGG